MRATAFLLLLCLALAGCRGDRPDHRPEAQRNAPAATAAGPVEEPAGDLADPEGNAPPADEPAADLTAVDVTEAGGGLTVTWHLAGPPSGASWTLLWALELYDGEALRATLSVQLVDARLVGGFLDWETARQQPVTARFLDGRTAVTATVPADLLDAVGPVDGWSALGQADESYEDRLPDRGAAAHRRPRAPRA